MKKVKMNCKLSWTRIQPKPDPKHGVPMSRSSHGVSLLRQSDTLIVYGGEHIARTPIAAESSACWACVGVSSDAPAWKYVDDCGGGGSPPCRNAHAQALYDDRYVYIFGGRAGITMAEQALNDMWVLDTSDYSWTEVTAAAGTPPEARSFHAMLGVGSTLYVFGGCGAEHGRLGDLHAFDVPTRTWRALGASAHLQGRGGPNLLPLASGRRIAAVAGFAGAETADGHAYDVAKGRWDADALTPLLAGLRPRSVSAAASFPAAGVAIIFGGEVDPSERGHEGAGGFENDLVVLDEATGALIDTVEAPAATAGRAGGDEAERPQPWPEPRGWSHAAAFEDASGTGRMFVFGGLSGDDANPKRLNDLWRLNVDI